jgi:hypothetical protein
VTSLDLSTCFFGIPSMGSWKIRAKQVATARASWYSAGNFSPYDVLTHRVFCAVKRPFHSRLRLLRALGKITVYDVVDFWVQPDDGLRYHDVAAIRAYFTEFLAGLQVDGVIFPNRTMMEDLGDLVPNPVCIYHHFWPDLEPIEVRERAAVVGYQGKPAYLGPWRKVIERLCRRFGLQFVVNPSDLRAVDIGLAARGGVHASTMAHRYKSNVKLANFYGGGIPCVVNSSEHSYHETDNGEVRFFATEAELADRLAELLPHETRLRIHRSFLAARTDFTLEAIATRYEQYLHSLVAQREV